MIAPDTVLNATYRIVRAIGVGGMGTVYEAEHTRLPRRYAVKVLNPEIVANPDVFARFRREAEIANSLGSDHIVQVFDFNRDQDGTVYMVLELLEGEDLAARLSRARRLSLAQTASVIWQTAEALAAAHGAGIVHRDLKPQNVYLCRTDGDVDLVKVLDFGISKILHHGGAATRTGTVMGTPNYMAPEQAIGQVGDQDARTDVFALGLIAYECLAGRPAFAGDTPVATLYQICHQAPAPLRSLSPHVPEAVERVLDRAIAKSRDSRHESAACLREEFVRACGMPPTWSPYGAGPLRLSGRLVRPAAASTAPALTAPAPAPASPVPPAGWPAPPPPPPIPPAAWPSPPPPSPIPSAAWPASPPPSPPPLTPAPRTPASRPPSRPGPGTLPFGAVSTPFPDEPEAAPAPGRRATVWIAAAGALVAAMAIAGFWVASPGRRAAAPASPETAPPATSSAPAGSGPAAPAAAPSVAPAPVPPQAPAAQRPPGGAGEVQTVTLDIRVEPPGALVEIDGVATRAGSVTLPRGDRLHRLAVSAPGHRRHDREFSTLIDGEIVVTLDPEAAAKAATPRTRPAPAPRGRGGLPMEDDLGDDVPAKGRHKGDLPMEDDL